MRKCFSFIKNEYKPTIESLHSLGQPRVAKFLDRGCETLPSRPSIAAARRRRRAAHRCAASRGVLKSSARSRFSPRSARGKLLEVAVLRDEARGGFRADARDAWITVGRVADEREIVGDERRARPRTSPVRARRRESRRFGDRPGRRDRRRRTARDPCPASRCTPSRPAVSSAARCAADARASSASSSTIGHVVTPIATSDSSSGWNCAHNAGSMPSPVL